MFMIARPAEWVALPRRGIEFRAADALEFGVALTSASAQDGAFIEQKFGKLDASSRTSLIWDFSRMNRWSERE